MEKKLLFSFDDEITTGFYYEKWEYAKSKLSVDNRYKDLEDHIGIISMILDMHIADKKMFLTVNTLDGQYVDLLFYNCNVKIEDIS